MSRQIQFEDTVVNYVSIREARAMSGLRLILGAYAAPGPWREACKALFYVKGLEWVSVRTANEGASDIAIGMDGTQSELIAWTGQASAPVAVWNDERPRSAWYDQLNLAERLAPEPRLVPEDITSRARMFGLINELAGENGLAWSQRVMMCVEPLRTLAPDDPNRAFWDTYAAKYRYSEQAAAVANARIIDIINTMERQLAAQHNAGLRYFMGDRLSALDLYWACFLGLLKPLPEDLCPMATAYRPAYSSGDPGVNAAITQRLTDHRDFIYEQFLELPIVF